MNTFDIIVIVILSFGFIRGFMKGLLIEVATLVALLAGVYGALHFSYFVGDWLKNSVSWKENYISLVAFAITFVIIIVAIVLLGKILTRIAKFAYLGFLNKLLGGVFGLLKFGLIISIVLIFFQKINDIFPFIKEETLSQSILYSPVKLIAPTLFPSIIKGESISLDINEL